MLHLGNRREGMVRYEYKAGLPFIPEMGGGVCLPQVYCSPLFPADDRIFFTDDIIWSSDKRGLFKLVVLAKSAADLDSMLSRLSDIESLSGGHVQEKDVTVILEDVSSRISQVSLDKKWDDKIFRIASAEEFASSELCNGRPEPQGYDPYRLGKEVKNKRFIFLRPDRFVFAACNTLEEVNYASRQVKEILGSCTAS